eukprot:5169498-Pleurochrysis_carterae.AAC.1
MSEEQIVARTVTMAEVRAASKGGYLQPLESAEAGTRASETTLGPIMPRVEGEAKTKVTGLAGLLSKLAESGDTRAAAYLQAVAAARRGDGSQTAPADCDDEVTKLRCD